MEAPYAIERGNAGAADAFRPSEYTRGRKFVLDVGGTPLLLVRGGKAGPTLSATAGIHGDEYEGIRTILEVFQELDPMAMSGDFLAAPCANLSAFHAGQRCTPEDGLNLARVFPGSATGSVTERIAWTVDHAVIRHADLFIDLHSGGTKFLMPSMIGYWTGDPRNAQAAEAFGARIIWAHPDLPPGRTLSVAAARGIPGLYTEARGAGRIDREDLTLFRNGIFNLLRYLRILPGAPQQSRCELRLFGDGNLDTTVSCNQDGFLVPEVDLLDEVGRGELLGRLLSLDGTCLESFFAPRAGVVALVHACPLYRAGEPLFLVTERQS